MMKSLLVLLLSLLVVVMGGSGGLWFHEESFGGHIYSFPPSYFDGRSDLSSGVFLAIYSRPNGSDILPVSNIPPQGCRPGWWQNAGGSTLSVGQPVGRSNPIIFARPSNPVTPDAEAGYRCWTAKNLEEEMREENLLRMEENWYARIELLERLSGIETPIRPVFVSMPPTNVSSEDGRRV